MSNRFTREGAIHGHVGHAILESPVKLLSLFSPALMHVLAVVYDIVGSTSDRNCVILNNIHIDVMDYILPTTCTEQEFRKMWAEFEWENKVR